jgi:hypothetical protein
MTSIETLLFGRGIRSLKPGLLIYNEVRQDREHRCTCGALDTPDGEPTETDTGIMGMTRQAPAAVTGGLVFQLQAKRQEEGAHELEKRLAITKQLKVGGFVLEINGDRPIFSALADLFWHGSPSRHGVCAVDDTP